jgi:hypothetical protein
VLRYFFDFVSADVTIRDATGAELPDLAAAHARAVTLAYQIDNDFLVPRDWRIDVTEESGTTPLTIISTSVRNALAIPEPVAAKPRCARDYSAGAEI